VFSWGWSPWRWQETAADWTQALLDELGEPVEYEELDGQGGGSGGIRVIFRRMGEIGVRFSDEPTQATVASVVGGSLAARTGVVSRGMVLRRIHTHTRETEVGAGMTAKVALRELRKAANHRESLSVCLSVRVCVCVCVCVCPDGLSCLFRAPRSAYARLCRPAGGGKGGRGGPQCVSVGGGGVGAGGSDDDRAGG
jgi:hypothetical protein